MIGEKLKEVLRAQPFRPLRLLRAGGRSLPVHHPDPIMISRGGRTAGRKDDLEIADVLRIQSIEFSNGRSGRLRGGR